jgi:hypothetical protein
MYPTHAAIYVAFLSLGVRDGPAEEMGQMCRGYWGGREDFVNVVEPWGSGVNVGEGGVDGYTEEAGGAGGVGVGGDFGGWERGENVLRDGRTGREIECQRVKKIWRCEERGVQFRVGDYVGDVFWGRRNSEVCVLQRCREDDFVEGGRVVGGGGEVVCVVGLFGYCRDGGGEVDSCGGGIEHGGENTPVAAFDLLRAVGGHADHGFEAVDVA